jgi:hypothetical protein
MEWSDACLLQPVRVELDFLAPAIYGAEEDGPTHRLTEQLELLSPSGMVFGTVKHYWLDYQRSFWSF